MVRWEMEKKKRKKERMNMKLESRKQTRGRETKRGDEKANFLPIICEQKKKR